MAVTTTSGNGYALYNGNKLPNIDSVWTDKETYPYAAIVSQTLEDGITKVYGLYLATKSPYWFAMDGGVMVCGWSADGTELKICTCAPTIEGYDDAFVVEGTETVGSGSKHGMFDKEQAVSKCIWTSHDILNEDGTTYLAASDPIPLDGYTVIEWDGDTEGLIADSGGLGFYKLTDSYFDISYLVDSVVAASVDGSLVWLDMKIENYADYTVNGNDCWMFGEVLISASAENASISNVVVPARGTYGFSVSGGTYLSIFAYKATSTDTSTYDKTAFLSGLAMGLCGKGDPTFSGAGASYLYNGLPLPDINNVWDKNNYPYVLISWFNREIETVEMFCSTLPFRIYSGLICSTAGSDILVYGKRKDETEWHFTGSHSPATGVTVMETSGNFIWTSHEITDNADVTFSTSEPVEDVFLKGYLAGAALRSKRVPVYE